MLVRPHGDTFEIVAGRRRYFAASKVAEEQGVATCEVLLPCAVAVGDSDADAMEASLIENVARAGLDELEEYEAFAKLLKHGRSAAAIDMAFPPRHYDPNKAFEIARMAESINALFT